MVQQFKHCSLYLSVPWFIVIESLCTNCIDFVNENNCWRFLFCKGECISDHLWTITDVHLHQSWSCKLKESSLGLSCTSSGHHGLSSTWRAKHQTSLWRSDTNVLEFFFVSDWQYDGFSQFFNLFIKAANVCVFLWWSFFNLHGSYSWIVFSWQFFE